MAARMTRQQFTTYAPLGLASLAAILQPWAPLWVFVTPILLMMPIVLVGYIDLRRDYNAITEASDLYAKWFEQRARCR